MDNRASRIDEIITDCLFRPDEIHNDEIPADALVVEGVLAKYGFHPDRIRLHNDEIVECLRGLPNEFYEQGGGGWTFLNLCNDADGHQWGEHRNMEALCVLAIASGHGRWQLPRELWPNLPGGMPYVVFYNL